MFGLGWSVAAALPLLFYEGDAGDRRTIMERVTVGERVERACECPHQYITRTGGVLRRGGSHRLARDSVMLLRSLALVNDQSPGCAELQFSVIARHKRSATTLTRSGPKLMRFNPPCAICGLLNNPDVDSLCPPLTLRNHLASTSHDVIFARRRLRHDPTGAEDQRPKD